ncbi:hypothetical protein AB7M49_003227 [Bradyrhizobium elkanii]
MQAHVHAIHASCRRFVPSYHMAGIRDGRSLRFRVHMQTRSVRSRVTRSQWKADRGALDTASGQVEWN